MTPYGCPGTIWLADSRPGHSNRLELGYLVSEEFLIRPTIETEVPAERSRVSWITPSVKDQGLDAAIQMQVVPDVYGRVLEHVLHRDARFIGSEPRHFRIEAAMLSEPRRPPLHHDQQRYETHLGQQRTRR